MRSVSAIIVEDSQGGSRVHLASTYSSKSVSMAEEDMDMGPVAARFTHAPPC